MVSLYVTFQDKTETKSYEDSNSHVKEGPKRWNTPKKTHKDARNKLGLFILLKKCWNLVLLNVRNRQYFIPHTKSQIVNGRL